MALELVRALARTELDDNLHMARVLLLVSAHAGRTNKALQGFTKLAKLDFLLRYPNCLERALEVEGKPVGPAHIQDFERTTLESKMVRFRYGPWDYRYRRWIAMLVARGLIQVNVEGRTVMLWLTLAGQDMATTLADSTAFSDLASRASLVAKTFGGRSGTKLKEFVYETFPEIISMKWGDEINL